MAVFTPVSEAEAAAFLEGYDLGGLVGLAPISEGVSNTNYRLDTDAGRFALTLFEAATPEGAPAFALAFTDHLASKGVVAPEPMRGRDGEALRQLNGKAAAIVRWLAGGWSDAPNLTRQFEGGATLARMHLAAEGLAATRPNALGPDAWPVLAQTCALLAQTPEDQALAAAVLAEIDAVAAQWPQGLASGAVHADYFPDNVLFAEDRVSGVIDFYYACTDLFAYDLAIALTSWGFDKMGDVIDGAIKAFLQGYESVRVLPEAERLALPVLARGAVVRFTLTRLRDKLQSDGSALITLKDPYAYFKRRERFLV